MSLVNILPQELKFEILLYLNDYVNNLFIYIYDIKKKQLFRKVNKHYHNTILIVILRENANRF